MPLPSQGWAGKRYGPLPSQRVMRNIDVEEEGAGSPPPPLRGGGTALRLRKAGGGPETRGIVPLPSQRRVGERYGPSLFSPFRGPGGPPPLSILASFCLILASFWPHFVSFWPHRGLILSHRGPPTSPPSYPLPCRGVPCGRPFPASLVGAHSPLLRQRIAFESPLYYNVHVNHRPAPHKSRGARTKGARWSQMRPNEANPAKFRCLITRCEGTGANPRIPLPCPPL